jgi:hypothetical protein
MNHPRENDLALFAGGEARPVGRLLVDRHLRGCAACREKIAGYHELRFELAAVELPDLNWNFLAAEMRANIRVGLEAGACVRTTRIMMPWNTRLGIAFASLVLLVVYSFFLRDHRLRSAAADGASPVLQSTISGVEFRTGTNSLTLLNHRGNATNQTVSAQGDIAARYIDGETGSVTITNVYLQ